MQLVDDLRRLGVVAGDTVMVHASLRAIGAPAREVIAAIDAALGPTGTWMMTLGARDPDAHVQERPEHERAALLADAEPFDALRTPAQEDVGYLAEAMRCAPGTLVTAHPEGRFGARGARAAWLLSDPPWDDYYGPRSPLEHLCELSGRVLRLGADENTVTLLHYAEYLADVPNKRRVKRYRRARDGVRTIECLDDSDGIVEWRGEDYFALVLRAYLATGAGARGVVGGARSELLDARELVAFGVRWMEEHLA